MLQDVPVEMDQLIKQAEIRMYEEKERYYRQTGKERYITFLKDKEYILLQYFGREYRLNCGNGVLEKIFLPFPEIPVKLVFWEKDEEFPAQVRVFVRENATDYVHYEAISFMIADMFQKIDETIKKEWKK